MNKTVFLVGPRAAGKTTFGRVLAEYLGCSFVDSDIYLRETSGLTVVEIVGQEGWEGFRKRESEALRQAAAPGMVLATGGGMVLAAANRNFMRKNGVVFYLAAPAEVLAARLSANPENAQRPSLTGKSVTDEISQILSEREPLYREIAHHILDATWPLDKLLEKTCRLIKREF